MSSSQADWSAGDVCYVGGLKQGTVRFVGSTQFAEGEWIGVELLEPEGRNDGSVQGVRYFECKDNFGLFCKWVDLTFFFMSVRHRPSSISIHTYV